MAFNGNEGSVITLATAAGWTQNFRDQMKSGEIEAHFFGKQTMQAIIQQTGCKGIRFYNGINDSGQKVLILVGADADESDLVNGVIVDQGIACPPRCGQQNELNS